MFRVRELRKRTNVVYTLNWTDRYQRHRSFKLFELIEMNREWGEAERNKKKINRSTAHDTLTFNQMEIDCIGKMASHGPTNCMQLCMVSKYFCNAISTSHLWICISDMLLTVIRQFVYYDVFFKCISVVNRFVSNLYLIKHIWICAISVARKCISDWHNELFVEIRISAQLISYRQHLMNDVTSR